MISTKLPVRQTILTSVVLLCSALSAFAATPTKITVWSGDMHGWQFVDDRTGLPCGTPDCEIVFASTAPPSGAGTARLAVDTVFNSEQRSMLFSPIGRGATLETITDLKYSTFVWMNSSSPLAPVLVVNLDFDLTDANTTWQGRLVFDPKHQAARQPIVIEQWQTWDAIDGGRALWYFTADAPAGGDPCPETNPCTLAQVKEWFPHAGIHATLGGVGIYVGGWNVQQVETNVDAITVGVTPNTTLYDFEMDGSTASVIDVDSDGDGSGGGSGACAGKAWVGVFRNYGQCVEHYNQYHKTTGTGALHRASARKDTSWDEGELKASPSRSRSRNRK